MPVMGETGADAGIRVPRYQTTLDRAGLALATGGVLYGALAMLLAARGGEAGVLTLIAVLVVGAVLAMLAITATFGPLWLALHASGRRGPGHAAAPGAKIGRASCGERVCQTVSTPVVAVPLKKKQHTNTS